MRTAVVGRGRLLAVSVVVLLAACSSGSEVPEQAAEDAPGRTTSTTAAPPPGLERVTASPSALEGEQDSRFTGVVVGARAIVVIGELDGEAAIWTTFDGVVYDPVPLDDRAFPAGTELSDVVVTSDGFVVVGSAAGQAAAWTSPDGRTWLPAPLPDGDVADVVIVGELGITAFGREGGDVVTWTSFDGLDWERVPGDVLDGPGGARVVGAYDDGDGFLAVVDRDGVAEAWTSPDGRSWEPRPLRGSELLPAGGTPRPTTLLGAGSTAVVLGSVAEPDGVDAAVWVSVAGEAWERSTSSEAVFGGDGAQVVRAATQLGSDLVAVGTDVDDTGDVDAVVWSTGAGGGWRRSPEQAGDGLSGPGDQHAADIAPTREGALVVGWEAAGGSTRAVAWSLVDGDAPPVVPEGAPGLQWQRVPPTGALGGPGEQRLDAVVPTPDGFLAVGSSARPDEPDGDVDGAVWRSGDGIEWARVPEAGPAMGGPGDQRLLAVAAVAGRFVAAGVDGEAAAVWTSDDGRSWSPVAGSPEVFDGPGAQVIDAIAAGADGSVVAVGADGGTGDAAVWRSVDGVSGWQRVLPGGDLGGEGTQVMTDVALVGPVLVAVGSGGAGASAWTSLDGVTWQRSDLGDGVAHAVAAVEGGGAVAVGALPGAATGSDATAWRSTDGRTWSPAPIDDGPLRPADQALLDVAQVTTAEGEQLVAGVGWTDLGPGEDGAAWASRDGEAWSRTPHDEDVFGGDQAQRMQALAAADDVVVAVGWSGSTAAGRDAAVWVTAPASGGAGIL